MTRTGSTRADGALPPGAALAERLALRGTPAQRAAFVRALCKRYGDAAEQAWAFWGRLPQHPPDGWGWRTWLIQAGRGFGKTRAGAEWVRLIAENDPEARIALVGATMAEARSVMVEGDSGLLAIAPDGKRPRYEPSLGRLIWPTGAMAWLYSAAEPDALRGPQHSHAWCDEIAKWSAGENGGVAVWDMLAMTLRIGDKPRIVATTTPKPVPLVRRILANAKGDVVVTRGRSEDNSGHLSGDFLAAMDDHYRGTRLGRQELDGELIEDVEGALWSRDLIERQRVEAMPTEARRIVVGVDPPAGAGAASDACGIVVAALGEDRKAYVIADASVQGLSPECRAELGDKRCRADLSRRVRYARITAVVDAATFDIDASEPSDNAYGYGRLRWIEGTNSGMAGAILRSDGARIYLREIPAAAVGVGTLVELTEGCNKIFATCRDRFANGDNFRGEPHLPGADLLTRYPGA